MQFDRRIPLLFVVFMLAVDMVGCGARPKSDSRAAAPAAASKAEAPAPAQVDRTGWPVIVVLGDSLTAGYRLRPEEAYPHLLQEELDRLGYKYRVINAGISGDTTTQGLARLSVTLAQKPSIVILSLGGNDGLRGQPISTMRGNLSAMIERLQSEKVQVVLAGIQIPPNYGPEYTQEFRQTFFDLADKYRIPLIPFILEGVAAKPDLNLPDGIHPTAEGHKIMLKNVLPVVMPLLKR